MKPAVIVLVTAVLIATTLLPSASAPFAQALSSRIYSCGRDVPSGTAVLDHDTVRFPNGTIYRYAPRECSEAANKREPMIRGLSADNSRYGTDQINGEQPAYVAYTLSSGTYSYLESNWVVPAAPSNTNDPWVMLWNGLEPSDSSKVVQPVLSWGCQRPAGGGSCLAGGAYWWIASWIVYSDGTYYRSTVYQVSQGDTINGKIQRYSTSTECGSTPGFFIYTTRSSTSTSIVLCTSDNLPAGFAGTLEAHRLDYCNQWPGSGAVTEQFTSISSTPSHTSWNWYTNGNLSPQCSYSASYNSGTNVATLGWSTN